MMLSEIILEAIGGINDDFINEYAELKASSKDKKIILRKWLVMAACLAIVIIAAIFGFRISNHNPDVMLTGRNLRKPEYSLDFTSQPTITKEPVIATIAPTVIPSEISTVAPTENVVLTENPEITETLYPEITETPVQQERDWQSEWTYFIAHLDSEQGKGVMSHPDDKVSVTNRTDSEIDYSDEYFMENSQWLFKLSLNNSIYIARKSEISKNDIGAYIQDADLNICERRLKYYDFYESVSLYSLNNISPKAALAISIGADEYCLLVNTDYTSGSFNEFVRDFNLLNTTDLKELACFDNQGNVIDVRNVSDDNLIWETLLKNTLSVTETDLSGFESAINISVDSRYYSFYDISFSIYEEGYIYFNILGNKLCFTIDAENVINLLNGKE